MLFSLPVPSLPGEAKEGLGMVPVPPLPGGAKEGLGFPTH